MLVGFLGGPFLAFFACLGLILGAFVVLAIAFHVFSEDGIAILPPCIGRIGRGVAPNSVFPVPALAIWVAAEVFVEPRVRELGWSRSVLVGILGRPFLAFFA